MAGTSTEDDILSAVGDGLERYCHLNWVSPGTGNAGLPQANVKPGPILFETTRFNPIRVLPAGQHQPDFFATLNNSPDLQASVRDSIGIPASHPTL